MASAFADLAAGDYILHSSQMNQLKITFPILLGIATTGLTAQNFHYQPEGYAAVEGNSSTSIPFSFVSARVHQADSSRIGLPLPAISALAFRRDRSAGTTATARTVDITIMMGKTNVSTFSSTFANNWIGTPVTVYTTKPTNLPDLTVAPPAPPGPFNVAFAFDTPYTYDGVDSLLWELQVDNGITGTYSMDWVSAATNTAGGTTTALGAGCTTANGAMSLTTAFSATQTTLNLSFSTLRAPSSVPLTLLFGLSDPNISSPSLCTALRTDAVLQLPLGTSGATGSLASIVFPLFYNQSWAGVDVFSQVIAPDATQAALPLALSNGRQSPLPLTAGGPAPTAMRRTYSTVSSSAPTGITVSTSAVATRLTY